MNITLNAIFADVADHLEMKKEDLIHKLWGTHKQQKFYDISKRQSRVKTH
jgi:hypothetical protein